MGADESNYQYESGIDGDAGEASSEPQPCTCVNKRDLKMN